MSRYQQEYKEMVNENKQLFDEFKVIHDKYAQDDTSNQEEFNRVGEKVVAIIRDHELHLTSKAESGQYAKYSSTLADKFWDLIRREYPEIDFVGAKIS